MKSAKLIVAESEHNSDMRYVAGFSAPDEFIFFEPDGGEPTIVVSKLELGRAEGEAKPGVRVLSCTEFGTEGTIQIILKIAADYSVSTFCVPEGFPLLLADELRRTGLTIIPQPGGFFPSREFKSSTEVEEICRALRITEKGMRRAFEIIAAAEVNKDGVLMLDNSPLTSEKLRREIEIEFVRHGAMASTTIAACGVHSAQPHCAGYGNLYAEQVIVLDLFPRVSGSGYWGDLTRTVVKGKASEEIKRAFDAVLEAREAAKNMLKIGVNPAEVHKLAKNILTGRGFPTGVDDSGHFGFFHGLGHGVGLDIHEAPRVSSRNCNPLRGGEVVTVEPGVYYPRWGGVRLEDMVVITDSGNRCLTEIETFLEI